MSHLFKGDKKGCKGPIDFIIGIISLTCQKGYAGKIPLVRAERSK